MRHLSCRQRFALKISARDDSTVVKKLKQEVKQDKTLRDKFEEYNVPIDEVDGVAVVFEKLPVSAKTKDMKIYLNEDMLDPNSEIDPTEYLIHELVHYLQQRCGETEGHNATDDYLEKPTEEEAFKAQIDYKEESNGEEDAEEYVDGLLDYHDYKGKKRERKKKELME